MPEDVRVFKSKRDIETALIQLTLEKDFHRITIQQICQKALVSRSTFYSHYLDKYDVIEQLAAKTRAQLEEKFSQKYQAQISADNLQDFLADIYNFYQENRLTLKALLKTPLTGKGNFEESFRQLCQKYTNQLFQQENARTDLPPQLLTELFTVNILTLMKWMLDHQPSAEITAFANQMHRFFLRLIQN
ncbi:TetR/AcrR family transcriptional regulator [Streptococcus devriesei]|uniref:TetR/AcrR family transcriptional regulator n=1 Tax=Streptococcus devriesei TaxID=231233 RepID=UPI0004292739|nr:TetR/AcrR family transcriptional regulator [Streptococcus devriesei]